MPDWTKSMQQTFDFYTVDAYTWKNVRKLTTITSCTINRDEEAETLGSASFNIDEPLEEQYISVILVTNQNGVVERHPLGVFLAQTPSSSFDGKIKKQVVDAYTPLLELKEKQPPIGYTVMKNENVMEVAKRLISEFVRAPVGDVSCATQIVNDFVASTNDSWLSFISDFISYADYKLALDEYGMIMFSPIVDISTLRPVWTYNDDNSSILYDNISLDHDIYGIPNVVEVIYSNNSTNYTARAVNSDINSPISTVSRGREIVHRIINPQICDILNGQSSIQQFLNEYAVKALRELSTTQCTVTYTHGYCPVRLGDCVQLNYTRAGIVDVKAKVISQSISCKPGCPVTEKAVFTNRLWGDI